jgi:type III restriction enzyme
VRGFEVNTLTVIATESYEQFAENLQKEIEADTGIQFGVVREHQFAGIAVARNGGDMPLGFDQSKALWEHLQGQGYINARARCRTLKTALKDGTLALPAFEPSGRRSPSLLRKLSGKLEIKNADERKQCRA